LRISVAQVTLADSIEAGVAKTLEFIGKAADDKSDFVCFPEMNLTGYGKQVLGLPNLKQRIDDAITRIADECSRLDIGALIGHAYPEHGFLYNRATILSPSGPVAHYDKMNLVDVEKKFLHPGIMPTLFPLGELTAGVIICRDQNDPYLAATLKEKGAQLLFLPTAHLNDPETARRKLDKDRGIPITRAVENEFYVFLANPVGSHVGLVCIGNSLIADPEGFVIASAGDSEETLLSVMIPSAGG